MGYTHYWRNAADIAPDTWQAICDDVRKLAKGFEGAKVEIDASEIVIRGSHEPFVLERAAEDFEFCKTRQGTYDKLVCATLAVAQEHHPALHVSSDGFMQDDFGAWRNAMDWASSTLGRKVPEPGSARANSRWTDEPLGEGAGIAQSQGKGQSH